MQNKYTKISKKIARETVKCMSQLKDKRDKSEDKYFFTVST